MNTSLRIRIIRHFEQSRQRAEPGSSTHRRAKRALYALAYGAGLVATNRALK